jgi:hypothetical protein
LPYTTLFRSLFEYYSLIDKSDGEHVRWLQNYDIPTGN